MAFITSCSCALAAVGRSPKDDGDSRVASTRTSTEVVSPQTVQDQEYPEDPLPFRGITFVSPEQIDISIGFVLSPLRRPDYRSHMPSGSIAPEVLQLSVIAHSDHFKVEAV
jgi:hypothetical protein